MILLDKVLPLIAEGANFRTPSERAIFKAFSFPSSRTRTAASYFGSSRGPAGITYEAHCGVCVRQRRHLVPTACAAMLLLEPCPATCASAPRREKTGG